MKPLENIVFIDFTDEGDPFTLAVEEHDKNGPYLHFYDVVKDGETGFLLQDAGESSSDHQVIPNFATYWALSGVNIVEPVVADPSTRLDVFPDLTTFFGYTEMGYKA